MSNYTLVIGNKNYSSWSLRPWIFMKQFNIKFSEKRISLFTDTMENDLNPYFSNSKVPVLLDGNITVWDSLAIMEYISEQQLNNTGWPIDTKARAFARSISAEMHSSFNSVRNELPMNCRKNFNNFILSDAVLEDINRIKNIWSKCRNDFSSNGKWLFDEFSIADAMFAPIVLRFKGYNVPLNEHESSYVQNFLNLDCVKEWIKDGEQEKEIIEIDEV